MISANHIERKPAGAQTGHTGRPGLFEYLLIITPDRDVYDKVMEEKEYFSKNYQQPKVNKTRPHITVFNFFAWDDMEDTLTRWLERIARQQRSFAVTLNNYSGLPSHTVFIRIQDPAPLKELSSRMEAIAPYIKERRYPSEKPFDCPYVSIARQLSTEVYDSAIRDYAGKDFNASFNVNELVLVRRQSQDEACKEVAVFRLQSNGCNN